MQIRHLKHQEIDYGKWNRCISHSKNGLIYAETWFLDVVSPGWEALVCGDYEYVMPLPVKKKFGLKYLVQPVMTQQLGVFSPFTIDSRLLHSFIRSVPYFSYEMNLNEQNFITNGDKRINLLLDLRLSVENIEKKFSKNTKRNIAKAQSNRLIVSQITDVEYFLDYYYRTATPYPKPDERITRELIRTGVKHESAELIGAYNQDLELIAALCLLKSDDRLIYLLPISGEQGKKLSAMFLIVWEIIKKHAESNRTLDFEGSMIEGIAGFYKGFGAGETSYYTIKRFRPQLLKRKT